MILEIKIPSPGESVTEALLSTWLVKDNDFVQKDQELAEIESDKATLPLIAPENGKIKILIQEGETVKIGAVACTVDTDAKAEIGSQQPDNKHDASSKKYTKPSELPRSQTLPPIAGTISRPEGVTAGLGVLSDSAKNQEPRPISNNKPSEALIPKPESSNLKITPVAQKMMDEHGLSANDFVEGVRRVGKEDVEAVIAYRSQSASSKGTISRAEDRKKISPLRKKLGERLVAVKNQTAMLTTFNEADMSSVIELRKKYQSQFEAKYNIKIGFMSFFVKAVAQALKLHPNVNSMIDGDEIVTPNYYDISIAVQTDKGLTVPVLRNADTLSFAEIELGIAQLAAKARSGRISMEEVTGGTFTITNGGVFGSLLSTPIINPPQSAILGMHNIVERPVAIKGKVEIRPMMYIALSYDHRVIDGKDSVSFLVNVKQFIEDPVKMLFDDGEPEKMLLGL